MNCNNLYKIICCSQNQYFRRNLNNEISSKKYFLEDTQIPYRIVETIIFVVEKIINNLLKDDKLFDDFILLISKKHNLDVLVLEGGNKENNLMIENATETSRKYINKVLYFISNYVFVKFPKNDLKQEEDYEMRVIYIHEAINKLFVNLLQCPSEKFEYDLGLKLLNINSYEDGLISIKKDNSDIFYEINTYKCGLHLFLTIMDSMVNEIAI